MSEPAERAPVILSVLDLLERHIWKEEWDLFPAALGIISAESFEDIARIHREEEPSVSAA